MVGLAQRLQRARVQAGLSQRDLAARIGVSHGTVAQWERDLKKPGRDNLFKIADLTNSDANELLGYIRSEKTVDCLGMFALFAKLSEHQRAGLLTLLNIPLDDENRQLQDVKVLQWFVGRSAREQQNFLELLTMCVDLRRELEEKSQPSKPPPTLKMGKQKVRRR
jgi:transcriptional regulator with XRE-family HTH domain